jgi:hypothetical protein
MREEFEMSTRMLIVAVALLILIVLVGAALITVSSVSG